MVERRSHVADSPEPRRLGMEWFLDAVFPNGRTVTIRGFAGSEASECPGSFRYVKSAPDNCHALNAQAAIAASSNENARASGLAIVAATLFERAKKIWSHSSGRSFDVQTYPAAVEWSVALACGLASLASRSRGRLGEKWKSAVSSPWFALLCAGVSFAVLLLLTGAFAGMALTKQPARTDMTGGPPIAAITPREQSQLLERKYDNDLIAVLIELTSHPGATGVGPASLPTTPEEAESERSAPVSVPLGLPRILLDARSFATVPLNDRSTNNYSD
jgi:hypothetical protein